MLEQVEEGTIGVPDVNLALGDVPHHQLCAGVPRHRRGLLYFGKLVQEVPVHRQRQPLSIVTRVQLPV
jgi:hypothetical protein